MLIIGIVIEAFAVPATTALLRGSQVTQASQIVTDQLNLARQHVALPESDGRGAHAVLIN